ncbi:hypothetical protein RBG61_02035 [Paludicola sp. MB14-C6]|uniref:hypothetical protein n=1 Tax=Paludihabitans sp. MB14-C6 TaxID=3070656 RepID=UPI0027DEA331|nr:hypothetical protein [Paludicola sp. MB14-C6]WMJ23471.1 hypothetical protein RBG61_02035 [Paludicola sp. MB14-C6]
MIQHELEQYRSLVAEIVELNYLLKQGLNEKKAGNIKARIQELSERVKSIEDFINAIQDSKVRRIFFYRYMYSQRKTSWQDIAFRIGEHDESYPRRIHKHYMKVVETTEL